MKYLLYHINFDVKGENYIDNDKKLYNSMEEAKQAAREYLMQKNAQDISEFHAFGDKFMHTGQGYKYKSQWGDYNCAVLVLTLIQ